MLGSEYDGERASAGLHATNLLQEHKLTWRDVLRVPETLSEPPRQRSSPPQDERTDARDLLDEHEAELNDWEREFLHDIARRGVLTSKQRRKLREIRSRCE